MAPQTSCNIPNPAPACSRAGVVRFHRSVFLVRRALPLAALRGDTKARALAQRLLPAPIETLKHNGGDDGAKIKHHGKSNTKISKNDR